MLGLAGLVTATQTTRDAISAIEDARSQVHDLLGRALLDDVTCTSTGEVTPVIVVSDNGPCYKSHGFTRCIASRPGTHARPHPTTIAANAGWTTRRSTTAGHIAPPAARPLSSMLFGSVCVADSTGVRPRRR